MRRAKKGCSTSLYSQRGGAALVRPSHMYQYRTFRSLSLSCTGNFLGSYTLSALALHFLKESRHDWTAEKSQESTNGIYIYIYSCYMIYVSFILFSSFIPSLEDHAEVTSPPFSIMFCSSEFLAGRQDGAQQQRSRATEHGGAARAGRPGAARRRFRRRGPRCETGSDDGESLRAPKRPLKRPIRHSRSKMSKQEKT